VEAIITALSVSKISDGEMNAESGKFVTWEKKV
jgi:hypothetical protein